MLRNRYPVLVTMAAFMVLVAFYLSCTLALTHGHLAYCLDDAYIHLAVAKNLVHHGVWGISPDHWSGVSSSLIWTALLAGIFVIFGVNECIPFILNIVLVLALLWLLDTIWLRIKLSTSQRLILLTATFFLMPLASQPFIGMEVMIQCLLVAVFYFVMSWNGRDNSNNTPIVISFIAAFLLGAVRYETILIVELVAVGMLLRGEGKRAMTIAVAGALPATIYGVCATAFGGTFVPNTLFLKAKGVEIIGQRIISHSMEAAVLGLGGIALGYFAYYQFRKRFPSLRPSLEAIVIVTTVITALAQGVLSNAPGQFERYRTYLYLSLVLSVGAIMARPATVSGFFLRLRGTSAESQSPRAKRMLSFAPSILLLVLAAASLPKFFFYLQKTPIACKNIYDEQVQEARFIKLYCQEQPVVVVDIGAPSFYAESPLIDLIGLGSDDIARVNFHHKANDPSQTVEQSLRHYSDTLNSIVRARHARLAILYPILGYWPDTSWILMGRLAIDSNYVCAKDTVGLYALRLSDTAWLGQSLRDFRGKTTSHVLVR